jgi:hypothetical protein
MLGRPAGIRLTFGQAYAAACAFGGDYWYVAAQDGALYSVWHDAAFIGMSRTTTGARAVIVRHFECMLTGQEWKLPSRGEGDDE